MIRRVAVVALITAMMATLVFVTSFPTTCPLRLVLHVPCPTCGITRATRLAIGGDFAGATRMHPLWLVVLPWIAVVGGVQIVHFLRTGVFAPLDRWPIAKRSGQALLALLVVVWVARFFGAFGGPAPV